MLLFETEARVELTHQECDFLTTLFSDETELYRSPAEPEAGETVRIRLRAKKTPDCRVWLVFKDRSDTISMSIVKENDFFSWYEAEFICPDQPVSYCFLVENGERSYICKRFTSELMDKNRKIDFERSFRIVPGFHTPKWAKGALQYQIFVDRFRNGCPANDPVDGEYCYEGNPIRKRKDWYAVPDTDDFRCFYGGDLQGVAEKLDYLKSLGVEAIYFNPIFLSPSDHKYDTQDYEHIDPHFAVISEDLEDGTFSNDPWVMDRYIKRVTSWVNLKESDDYFAWLCGEIHKRGMRVILDGVFNHCGSFNRWMDGKDIYARAGAEVPGAWQSENSPYRNYFRFNEKGTNYDSWWGHPTLPKLNYEGSPELCEEVYSIACKWASEPYCIDGWRLDVAADLGHSEEFNHKFWAEFRRRVKAVNPEILIIAEHYGNPVEWLSGGQWDSVMNYDAFMEPLSFFLTGMEKHSDYFHDGLYQDGPRFFRGMRDAMSKMDLCSLQCAMNELSNHDHSRFLTRTNHTAGRLNTMGGEQAGKGIDKRVMREAVVIQMTWPGAPTIYYGDEAGLVGWTDPDNRRCYPWGREDEDLIEMHRRIAALRSELPVLRTGSLKALDAGKGWIAYSRFNENDRVVTVCNNGNDTVLVRLYLRDAGAEENEEYLIAFRTDGNGWSDEKKYAGKVKDGYMQLLMEAHSAVILIRKND
ncbi:MAG: glycoside hydrolase family 13 protein [Anaerolineaceae bacterium]|nr:glycoside hydrolase family 13 protein [Anaerolineaceae bacterium]